MGVVKNLSNAIDFVKNNPIGQIGWKIFQAGQGVNDSIGNFLLGIGEGIGNVFTGNLDYEHSKALADHQNQFNALEAQKARQHATDERVAAQLYNTAEAEKARSYNTMMSNTAFQRQVRDMKQAGYNPLGLIGGSGATVGSSTSASSHAGSSASANATGVPSFHNASAVGQTISSLTGSAIALARLGSINQALSKPSTKAAEKTLTKIIRTLK